MELHITNMITMSRVAQSFYDRLSEWIKADEYLHVVDYDGKSFYIQVTRTERLGQTRVLMANGANPIVPAGASDPRPVAFDFIEPPRQNRITQLRMYVLWMRTQGVGEVLATSLRQIDQENIPPLVEIEWQMPAGTARGGTDLMRTVTVNGIQQNIGGINTGRIPAYMVPIRDDTNEVFDIFCLYGNYPAFRVINNDPALTIGAVDGGEATELHLAFIGTKGIYRRATEEEISKIEAGEISCRGITIGGIKHESTKV